MATFTYLERVPAESEIPAGRVLVHNNVRPATRLGECGFRAWTQIPTDNLTPCDLGWAPEVPKHYKVARIARKESTP